MSIPKFKTEEDELLWDCLVDLKLTKYYQCFDKVRRQFYNHLSNEGDLKTLIKITDTIVYQSTLHFQNQKPEYNVHS